MKVVRFMKKAKKIDMTQGSIMKPVVLFALPICIGNILQQLYSTVDTLVVGNYCGTVSLAAVGTSSMPVEMFLCIFLGLGTGISILVSQYAGSGDLEQQKKAVSTSVSFLYMCAVPVTILGLFIGPLILKFMQVPADTWDYCVAYLNIIFLGTLGNLGYNMNAGILRGIGDSRSSLFFLIISCFVNVVLDLVFVAGFGMDVAGAALATIIAMYSSWLCSIIYIKKKYPELNITFFPRSMDKSIIKEMAAVGIPLGLNNSLFSLGHIVMQSLINAQGAVFMAACSISGKVSGLANVAVTSFASAATTFAGQNLGAKKYDRLKEGAVKIPLYSGIITLVAGLLVTLAGRPIAGLFTSDMAVVAMSIRYIRIVLPFKWTFAVFSAIVHFVNGMGEVKYPTVVNLLMLWAVRIPCGYLIAYFIDGTYVMVSFPISFAFGMFAMLLFYRTKRWKSKLNPQ